MRAPPPLAALRRPVAPPPGFGIQLLPETNSDRTGRGSAMKRSGRFKRLAIWIPLVVALGLFWLASP